MVIETSMLIYFLLLLPLVSFMYASVGHGGASGYLALMALFSFPNTAQVLLNERHLTEEHILDAIRVFEDEPRRTVDKLRTRSREIALGAKAKRVDCKFRYKTNPHHLL